MGIQSGTEARSSTNDQESPEDQDLATADFAHIDGFVSATFLRLNNVGMIQRRDAVITADKQANGEVTRSRLLDLQHFVSAHMNTGQNDVYLASQYERDKAALIQQAAASSESGEVINQKVDAICKPQFSG